MVVVVTLLRQAQSAEEFTPQNPPIVCWVEPPNGCILEESEFTPLRHKTTNVGGDDLYAIKNPTNVKYCNAVVHSKVVAMPSKSVGDILVVFEIANSG